MTTLILNRRWMCTMCQRCICVCPMSIDIPQLVYNARGLVRRSVFRAPWLRVNTTLEFANQTGYKHENGKPFDDLSWEWAAVQNQYRQP